MKIFVISDTHVPERVKSLPDKILKEIQPGDILFHCGDFTSKKAFNQLIQSGAEFHGVFGNMDDYHLRSSMPERKVVTVKGKSIGLTHGWGSPEGLAERVYKSFEHKPDVILFGHSHIPLSKKIGDTLMFNPGPLSGGGRSDPTYGQLFIEGDDVWGEHYDL
ncbi:MAG: YfcE family phosphodiesterase [candidate division Zixibacteria bacterium]|nr:YfcE family phosphodiesterase [candidate division Zixibacteria bacterium]